MWYLLNFSIYLSLYELKEHMQVGEGVNFLTKILALSVEFPSYKIQLKTAQESLKSHQLTMKIRTPKRVKTQNLGQR